MEHEEAKLDLLRLAHQHFRLADRAKLGEDEIRTINRAIHFAGRAINEYIRLEKAELERIKAKHAEGRAAINAGELINVVELNRSLRGRQCVASDLWQAIRYMLDRDLTIADWELVMAELEELAR